LTIPITSYTIALPASLRSDHLIGINRNADRHHAGTLIDFTGIRTVGVAFTLVYVYPINGILFDQAGGNHTDEEIRALLRRWIIVDRARFLLISVGYLALLRALSIAMPASGH
jgi:hypothetical protein